MAVFVLAWWLVAAVLLEQVDEDLVEDIAEFNQTFQQQGLEGLWLELEQEVAADGAANLFFQLYSLAGEPLRNTEAGDWPDQAISNADARQLRDNGEPVLSPIIQTLQEEPARAVYGVIQSGSESYVLQITESLEEREEILELLQTIFLVSMPVFILLSVTAGRFMSRRSLRGVEEVTSTAIEISNGAINRRVAAADRGEEIERLAATFNAMLDKIQVLIKGMREMTDNIAHDLKSPLARIRGLTEASLTGSTVEEDYQHLTSSIIEECDRLLHLINTMLDLSETEAGLNPEMQELNLSALIRDACDLYQPLADSSDIDLYCDCDKDVRIRGNRQFLQRLIGNLLDNAIKYTPAGGRVSIEQVCEKDDVLIKVADTGPGISNSDLPRIFERFYRCDLSRSKPGSGLGLSLASAIARAHLGDISVQSALEKGSLFTVRLPLRTPAP